MVRRAPKGFRDKAKGGKGKSLSKSAISRIMGVADSSIPGGSFSELARADKQNQVKYDRPGNLKDFMDKSDLYQQGIAAGGRLMPDGTLQMGGLRDDQGNPIVLKNAAGQTILSMSKPVVNAVAPTGIQLLGDAKRLLTGYNTLSYDPNAVGTPSTTGGTIVRNEGILSNIDPLSFIPGVGMAKKFIEGAKGVYDFMFPKPPVVNYGGNTSITVTETPINDLESSNVSDNPLFNIRPYDPISVSDMDPSTMTAEATGIEKVYDRIKQIQDLGSQYGLDNIQIDPFNLNQGIGYQNQFMYNDMPIDYGFSATPSGDFGFNLGLRY